MKTGLKRYFPKPEGDNAHGWEAVMDEDNEHGEWVRFSDLPQWIDAKKQFPPFDQDVLCFYEIITKKDHHKYLAIGYVRSTTKGKDYEYAEWVDKEFNAIEPLFWMPLPETPVTVEAKKFSSIGNNTEK